jgi:type I restriction enzyme S subunit
MEEYRKRVTTDVVTGKLDVREAAARLRDEAQDLEPLDEADDDADAEQREKAEG